MLRIAHEGFNGCLISKEFHFVRLDNAAQERMVHFVLSRMDEFIYDADDSTSTLHIYKRKYPIFSLKPSNQNRYRLLKVGKTKVYIEKDFYSYMVDNDTQLEWFLLQVTDFNRLQHIITIYKNVDGKWNIKI